MTAAREDGSRPVVPRRLRWLAGLLGGSLLCACAHEPAFRAELPGNLDLGGKAIAIIGDLQLTAGFVRFVRRREDNAEAQQELFADLKSRIDEIGALVIVGDLVFSGRSRHDWEHVDSLIADIAARVPVLAVAGNHDYPCWFVELCRVTAISEGMVARFPWIEPGQPYLLPSGELELLFLDTETGFEAQGQWLEAELARAADRNAVALVFFHRPAFTNSIDKGAIGSPQVQEFFVPALRAATAPVVVFNGHVHGLEVIVRDGVHYVTTAGGGGPRGPHARQTPDDLYRGPDCERAERGDVVRPLNYVLLRQSAAGIDMVIRGFCGAGDSVRELDRIEVPR